MKTVTKFLCDKCGLEITPNRGLIFKGNVCIVSKNIHERGGLIGDNFPRNEKGEYNPLIDITKVNENVFCFSCVKKILFNEEQKVNTEPFVTGRN